jgi:UDP-GlcNAc:undecaprenyl-phosphate GlcNAc-1-phosphate transferase
MDYFMISPVFLAFLLSFIATFASTPLVILIAEKLKLTDDPLHRYHPAHTHSGVIPRAGGLAILTGISIAGLSFLPNSSLFIGIFISSLLLTIVGLLDDRHDIHPYIRICTNAIAALIVIFAGARVPYITNPFQGGVIHLDSFFITLPFFGSLMTISIWDTLVAFLWIMWTMNIVGWSSGVDGQMPGFIAISALIIGLLSLRFSLVDPTQIPTTILAFLVAGAFTAFTYWNFYPQKIMPGYGGKTLAGFLLGILGILSYAKLGTALLVLGIPTIDAGYTLARRILSRKSPMKADRGHLHHKLLEQGWGRRRIALFYWGMSAILGAIALTIKSEQKLFALLLVFVLAGGFLVWVNYFSQFSKRPGPDNG